MAEVDVTELVARAREYADARDDGDSPYISDTALLAWLNQENRRLVRRVARLGYAWGETSVDFTSSTTLPVAVLAVTGVYSVSGTIETPLARLVENVRHRTDGRFWTAAKSATSGQVTIAVGTTGTYRAKYIPEPAKLVLAGGGAGEDDQTKYPAGWEEVLVLGAALRAKAKEGSDTESPLLRQLYQDEWEDIEVEASAHSQETIVRNVDIQNPPGYGGTNGPDQTLGWWYP